MPAKPRKGQTKKGAVRDEDEQTNAGDEEEWIQPREVKPDDQLDLTEKELKEEITRILTANNPHAPENIVRFSFSERGFVKQPQVDQMAILFTLDGNMLHKETDEARRQASRLSKIGSTEEVESGEAEEGEVEEEEEAEAADEDDELMAPASKGGKKLTNQFNYSERASQTYNNPYRERGTITEPPPRVNFSANATQWEIYDAYNDDFAIQQRLKENAKPAMFRKDAGDKGKRKKVAETSGDDVNKVSRAAKIVERMVNQNTFDDIAQDFKYWEDMSDEYRDSEGTLLPLWKFLYDRAKKLAVTGICWNPKYKDLFAVSFGSYDFMKQTRGLVCLYSLKNPSYPDYIYSVNSGVMCVDIHPHHPHLVAAGFYDGSVCVFNVAEKSTQPAYLSTAKVGKHTDPVWQVAWQKDDLDGNRNFFSVSSDGRVICWTLVKNEMTKVEIIKLKTDEPIEGPDGSLMFNYACGTVFSFHPQIEYLYLVGTERGKILKCSKAYQSQFLDLFQAHTMAVYAIKWNSFHPKIFATCSADWTVKIWDHTEVSAPLFVFDLNGSVGDIAWAPYSSTVFAACTADGKVFVYDLNVNKYEPICDQWIVQKKKTKLTHIAFNPTHPILVVGDDRGNIISLKLSPNLRKKPRVKKGEKEKDPTEQEINKMEKLLASVQEPDHSKRLIPAVSVKQ